MKARSFIQSKHEIHILDRLSACALQEIVRNRMNGKLASDFFQKNKAFVGVDDLLKVNHGVAHLRERVGLIKVFIKCVRFVDGKCAFYNRGDKDATRKITSPWYKIHSGLIAWLQRTQG